MFDEHIEESGDSAEAGHSIAANNTPYEIEDEEMEQLNRGGPPTDDSFAIENDPSDPYPDDQDTRHHDGPTAQVADVGTKDWEDKVAAQEREEELDARGPDNFNADN